MTEKFNKNEEIETVEGEYQETPTAKTKKSKKRFIKPLIGAAVILVVAGGVSSYAHNKYEQNLRAKVNEAYSKVKINVVAPTTTTQTSTDQNTTTDSQSTSTDSNADTTQNTTTQTPQEAKSQDEIKKIVADTIGVDQNSITFDRIRPQFGGEDRYGYGHHGFRGERGRFYQNNNNNTAQPQYTYDVEARANDLEYELEIDALTGQVLDIEIDAH